MLGYLIGEPLKLYIRSLAAPSGHPLGQFPFGPPSLEGSVVSGLFVTIFGLAAASLGFLREYDYRRIHPSSIDAQSGLLGI